MRPSLKQKVKRRLSVCLACVRFQVQSLVLKKKKNNSIVFYTVISPAHLMLMGSLAVSRIPVLQVISILKLPMLLSLCSSAKNFHHLNNVPGPNFPPGKKKCRGLVLSYLQEKSSISSKTNIPSDTPSLPKLSPCRHSLN